MHKWHRLVNESCLVSIKGHWRRRQLNQGHCIFCDVTVMWVKLWTLSRSNPPPNHICDLFLFRRTHCINQSTGSEAKLYKQHGTSHRIIRARVLKNPREYNRAVLIISVAALLLLWYDISTKLTSSSWYYGHGVANESVYICSVSRNRSQWSHNHFPPYRIASSHWFVRCYYRCMCCNRCPFFCYIFTCHLHLSYFESEVMFM